MQIFRAHLDILALEKKGISYYLLMITGEMRPFFISGEIIMFW